MSCLNPGCIRKVVAKGRCVAHYRAEWAKARRGPPKARPTFNERFWSHVTKDGPTMPHMTTPCWLWTGVIGSGGYGVLNAESVGRGVLRTHRISYEIHVGPIPDGLLVLHACDRRSCCNPAHLRVGTAADNSRDMRIRGRTGSRTRGAVRYNAKLTSETVLSIRADRSAGVKCIAIAAQYGVSESCVSAVTTGRSWRHVVGDAK